jgi:long-chain acyl-CoA synthetase
LPIVEVQIKNPDGDGVGEILARTPAAMSGYWGETSTSIDAEGWVSTGDQGRLDEEGYLYVVGRSKEVIIRGGENIACVHVEQTLLTHPDVIEAAVVALPHPDLGEEVGAALLLRPGAEPDIAELRSHAAQSLARFEVPTRWWIRRTPLPTNATGKISRGEITNEWMGRGDANIID